MEIGRWKRRKFVPEWGGNRSEEAEPVAVIFVPPTVGWMSRYRELSLTVPRLRDDVEGQVRDAEFVAKLTAWSSTIEEFRGEFLRAHIKGIENLTLDGSAVDLAASIEFIEENEGLREEVFRAILEQGSVGASQGKD